MKKYYSLNEKILDNKMIIPLPKIYDYKTAAIIQKKIETILKQKKDNQLIIIFDFKNVEYMDTAGLALCIYFSNNFQEKFKISNIPDEIIYVFDIDIETSKIKEKEIKL